MSSTVRELVASVSVYMDGDAFEKDQVGRSIYMAIKPVHDALYQSVLDQRLATSLVVTKRLEPLDAAFTVAIERPQWRPAYPGPTKSPLLRAPVSAFGKSWLGLRAQAEQTTKKKKPLSLWHDDPALLFESASGTFLGRTACVGHEGQVFYFAYEKEREWLAKLSNTPELHLYGVGEAVYRQTFGSPGLFGE